MLLNILIEILLLNKYLNILNIFCSPSNVSWVHHPLVSNAHLTIIFHASLYCAFLFRMCISSLNPVCDLSQKGGGLSM